jgi:hypothetical protein
MNVVARPRSTVVAAQPARAAAVQEILVAQGEQKNAGYRSATTGAGSASGLRRQDRCSWTDGFSTWVSLSFVHSFVCAHWYKKPNYAADCCVIVSFGICPPFTRDFFGERLFSRYASLKPMFRHC